MGDSDDEYQSHNISGNLSHNGSNMSGGVGNNSFNNKKSTNRDKFYRERDDSGNNSGYGNNRRDWNNSDRNSRGNDYKNNRMSSNQQYGYGHSNQVGMGSSSYHKMGGQSDYPKKYSHQSPSGYGDSSPPYKRNKKDYEDSGNRSYGDYSGSHSNYNRQQHHSHESDFPTQPPFLSFKLFLQQQDDNISDEEAIKKYNDYKMEFKKTQINNFFLEHKEEDWFKLRYHPDENYKRHNEHNQFILNRLGVFMDLMNKGWLNDQSVELDRSKDIIKFLDAVVIKLEGGSDEDLKILEDNAFTKKEEEEEIKEIKEEKNPDEKQKEEGNENEDNADKNETNGEEKHKNGKSRKRKSEDSGSESGAYTESENEDDSNKNSDHRKKKSSRNTEKKSQKGDLHKTCSIFMRNLAPSVTKQDLENLCKDYEGFKRVAISDPAPERGFFRRGWITFESNVDVKKVCWNLQNTKIKDFNPGAIVNRELTNRIRSNSNVISNHKSVIKNDIKIAMKIIQNMDKRWNIWQETNDQPMDENEEDDVADEEGDKLDESTETANLEKSAFSKVKSPSQKFLEHKFLGTNPLFENITDYLVDEINAEEEELLGVENSESKSNTTINDIEIDKNFNSVLDKLIMYLRVVHSFDFYNSIEYQQEDSMPNRCGIMFVRPSVSPSSNLKASQTEMSTYIKQFEAKMKPYTDYKEKVDALTAKKLGVKDRKEEVEKFIKTNTQELAADRWLCPLSGKKFKGPEFIRKHLFYKHMEKIVEVKKEVEYFNNYVYDPKRPQLPEHQTNKSGSSQQSSQYGSPNNQSGYKNQSMMYNSPGGSMLQSNMLGQMTGYSGGMQNRQVSGYGMQTGYMHDNMQQAGYGYNYGAGYSSGGYQMNRRGGYHMNRGYSGRGGRDSREMIQYKDLDAPEDN